MPTIHKTAFVAPTAVVMGNVTLGAESSVWYTSVLRGDMAPIIIEELLRALRKLFVEEGIAGIVVEQQARRILPITDRAIVLDRGRVVFESSCAGLIADGSPLEQHLGVTRQ